MHITWMPASKALHGSYFARPSFFLLFLFRNFLVSRFVAEHTLILAQVAQSGAERDQQLVFSFLLFSAIFALFAHFCTLVLQCLVTSVWALIYCFVHSIIATSRWNKKYQRDENEILWTHNIQFLERTSQPWAICQIFKNPSAKRKGLNFSCSAVKRQMTANKRV